jgi:hypothetical protein
MNTLASVSPTAVLAVAVRFTDDAMIVSLSDGREVSVPLEWFPRLRDANPEQRKNWRFIAKGIGMHWEEIDDDIAVSTLLRM